MPKKSLIIAGALALVLVLAAGCTVTTYNRLVSLDQEVRSQWAQVENVYQRRMDLIPNLVETVKGAAKFERDTLTRVIEARGKAVQASAAHAPVAATDPAALQKFQQAQDGLSSALSRLMVVVERYPELGATQNFRDLQSQLEGTENRIAVERMRYNQAARNFNTTRHSFPTLIFAGLFGDRFKEKGYFAASAGADSAPDIKL